MDLNAVIAWCSHGQLPWDIRSWVSPLVELFDALVDSASRPRVHFEVALGLPVSALRATA